MNIEDRIKFYAFGYAHWTTFKITVGIWKKNDICLYHPNKVVKKHTYISIRYSQYRLVLNFMCGIVQTSECMLKTNIIVMFLFSHDISWVIQSLSCVFFHVICKRLQTICGSHNNVVHTKHSLQQNMRSFWLGIFVLFKISICGRF